jgi:hypothetical protein
VSSNTLGVPSQETINAKIVSVLEGKNYLDSIACLMKNGAKYVGKNWYCIVAAVGFPAIVSLFIPLFLPSIPVIGLISAASFFVIGFIKNGRSYFDRYQ